MSFSLQQFEHDKSAYERPDRPWVCGKTQNGEACRIGPNRRGQCRATAECVPLRKGDRWLCSRPPGAGGKCQDGPLPDGTCVCTMTPCQPIRSERSRRNLTVSGTIAFALGLLILFGGSWFGPRFFSPGRLSMNHAELDLTCARCHSAGSAGFGGVIAMAMEPPPDHDESGHCLACHNFGENARSPHSLPATALAALADEASTRPASKKMLRTTLLREMTPSKAPMSRVACATCHREHQGRMFDLTRMDRVRCQSCHQHPFGSLPDGHPEFSADFPTRRRTRIAFNHKTHLEKHFPDEDFTAKCTTCHVEDPTGARMLVRGFDNTCGSCHHHRNQLRGSGLPVSAVSVFSLPAVDLDTLRLRGIWTGDELWPADASIGDEIPLTPFMRMLLAGDADMVRDLAHFEDSGRLLDLAGAPDEVVAAAGRVVWGVKSLIYRLTESGPDALPDLLLDVLGPVERTELDALVGQPADTPIAPHTTWQYNLATLRERYLPGLAEDMELYRADPTSLRRTPPATESIADGPPDGFVEPGSAPAATEVDPAGGDDDLLGGDDEDLLGGDEDDLLGGDDDMLGGDEDDLLGGGEDDLLGGEEDLLGGDEEEDDLLGGGDDLLGGDEDDLLGGDEDLLGGDDETPTPTTEAPTPVVEDPQVTLDRLREGFADASGWILKDAEYTVAYRPGGHANQFMYSWLERTSHAGDGPTATAARGLFDSLRAEKTPGLCIRCHSVDDDPPSRKVNWTGERPSFGSRQFTRFEHGPHFNFTQFRSCTVCHSVSDIDEDTVDAWKATYADGRIDPHQFAPSFAPITKAKCVECHTPQGAGDGCLSCHNYHVGEFPLMLMPPSFGAAKSE